MISLPIIVGTWLNLPDASSSEGFSVRKAVGFGFSMTGPKGLLVWEFIMIYKSLALPMGQKMIHYNLHQVFLQMPGTSP